MDEENPTMDFGGAIKQKITESVKNMDIVSMLQKIVAVTPEDEESEVVREKLQGVLDKYNDMSDSDREMFTTQLKDMLASKLSMKLQDTDINLDGLQQKIGEAIVYRLVLLAGGALILVILFVFFGYKLYKSIKEKELKREEKKKAKQMKKKK